MATHDWSVHIVNGLVLREILGAPPPPLANYDLFSVHVDERDSSVTLGFFAFGTPSGAVALWQAKGYNAVEFLLVCTRVDNFLVDGWTAGPMTSVTLAGTSVVLSGDRKRVSFEAGEIRAETPIGRLVSQTF